MYIKIPSIRVDSIVKNRLLITHTREPSRYIFDLKKIIFKRKNMYN